MTFFNFIDGQLHAEEVPLSEIAKQFGTPTYVYSRAAFETSWASLNQAFDSHPHSICYAVKANSNIAVLNCLARLGSGFDVVSEGELRRVIAAGGDPKQTVFSGVAKSNEELAYAISHDIKSINLESPAELDRVQQVSASLGKVQDIAIRVNPDVDPETHPYISTGMETAKFGIRMQDALEVYQRAQAASNLNPNGIACHIGSQITKTSPFSDALEIVADLHDTLKEHDINIEHLDLGGGLGIDYQGETPPSASEYVSSMLQILKQRGIQLPVSIEPGRYIAGNAGVLITTVEYTKSNTFKNFAIVDAGMNDLLRPSLYQAYHSIQNVDSQSKTAAQSYDVVGPVCESADVLGFDRELSLKQGDVLAIMSAGAYSYSMANNYNSRRRPAEIMVDGTTAYEIRAREEYTELYAAESLLPQ